MIEADEPSVTKAGSVQLPIIGRIAPSAHPLRWNTPADYVLRMHTVTCANGSPPPCYQALLQDVTL